MIQKIPDHSALIITTGAVILGIELTASRYMSPMFGSSLYIWGSILSVSLICLSLGYSMGGRLGERLADPVNKLLQFVLISAGWIGVLPFIQRPVASVAMLTGHIMGPIIVTTLLFALPLTLLATATPLVFADATRKSTLGTSEKMGNLFATSTLGSVAGALITSYLLIPLLGLTQTLYTLTLFLAVSTAPYYLRRSPPPITSVLFAALAASPHIYEASSREEQGFFNVIHRESSRYGEIAIVDSQADASRLLLIDGTSQNWVTGKGWLTSMFTYNDVIYGHVKQFPEAEKTALVLGLGAGTVSRELHRMGYEVDSVEIDPVIHELAINYFDFPEQLPVHLKDARVFLEEAISKGKTYGVIVLDVAGGGTQPTHLFNREAFTLMSKALSSGGALLVNQLVVVGESHDRLLGHTVATLNAVFDNVRTFNCSSRDESQRLVNMVSVASPTAPTSARYRTHIQERLQQVAFEDLRPLSDDWNPSELWSIEINRQWHRNIQNWLGEEVLIPI